MIHRPNYLLYRDYLKYLTDLGQHDPKSIQVKTSRLKWVLRWLDDRPIERSPSLRPTLPVYLAGIKDEPGHFHYVLVDARLFYRWLIQTDPKRFKAINELWIDTLHPVATSINRPADHDAVTLDMVRALLALPTSASGNLVRWRDQAAAAFLFLSGCRSSAFASLTLECVDIPARMVFQDPARGVKTKRKKSAITHLLEIADLLEFVARWDTYVRSQLETGYWYTVIDPLTLRLTPDAPGEFRAKILSRGLARLFEAAGLPAMSPHKFRHGHAVYGLMHARDIADLKAISQNLMHNNVGITDGIYAILSDQDRRERIKGLGNGQGGVGESLGNGGELGDVIGQLEALLTRLKAKS